MKLNYYVYNNEAIACCVLLMVLEKVKEIDYARLLLILPYLLDDRNISFLNKNKKVSIDFFLKKNNIYYNFNNRYLSLLPVTINSLIILSEMNLINFNRDGNICLISMDSCECVVSKRLLEIEKAIPILLDTILNYSTEYLYLNSGVEL
ncbi:three component ABC system middle component [Acinetobacter baumannii]|nr:DUF6521 family protein [Acinetobacter baumannii]